MALKVVFMGTPELAAVVLQALIDGPHEVVGVVSQPDKPAGRGKHLVSPPVAALARAHGLALAQPVSVKTAEFRRLIAGWRPDIAVVAAFGHLLGEKALAVPRLGSINVHASLLPRWRGASPIQMAIAAGDTESGVAIMRMDVGLDTGPVLLVRRLAIAADETAETLHDRLARLGAAALDEALRAIEAGDAQPTPQPEDGACYAPILTKADSDLDWTAPAAVLARRIRAFHAWPGTRTTWDGRDLKVLPPALALAAHAAAAPGTVVAVSAAGIDVACGEGVLRLGCLQLAGKRPLDAAAFLAGHRLSPGMQLGARASAPS